MVEVLMDTFPMNEYGTEMVRAMRMLADDPRTVFLGQWYGRVAFTLADIPDEKKIELPVIEDAQLGFCTGLSLAGFIPVSCYVRWPFLLLAANQIVNHLDKLEQMSGGGYKPKVIIRTAVGSTRPLYPGCQSDGDYTVAFRLMLTNIDVVTLKEPQDIVPAYSKALHSERSTIVVEYGNHFES
jgi:pyruvate/2-oxoglutarate/acetoin dehydrogenase E1 component